MVNCSRQYIFIEKISLTGKANNFLYLNQIIIFFTWAIVLHGFLSKAKEVA